MIITIYMKPSHTYAASIAPATDRDGLLPQNSFIDEGLLTFIRLLT